jgi:hypothetical protein
VERLSDLKVTVSCAEQGRLSFTDTNMMRSSHVSHPRLRLADGGAGGCVREEGEDPGRVRRGARLPEGCGGGGGTILTTVVRMLKAPCGSMIVLPIATKTFKDAPRITRRCNRVLEIGLHRDRWSYEGRQSPLSVIRPSRLQRPGGEPQWCLNRRMK